MELEPNSAARKIKGSRAIAIKRQGPLRRFAAKLFFVFILATTPMVVWGRPKHSPPPYDYRLGLEDPAIALQATPGHRDEWVADSDPEYGPLRTALFFRLGIHK